MKRIISILLATSLATPAVAQTATIAASTTPPIAVGAPVGNVLRAGTEVMLKTAEALTTEGKKLQPGQRVQLEVLSPVMLASVTVIPAGSPATAELTDVRNKGWGKSGRINARVLYVRVGDRQIRLSGTFDDKGTTGTAGVVASIALVPLAGFFVTGTSARIAMGSAVKAFLDEDVTVSMAQAAPPAVASVVQAAAATVVATKP